MPSARNSGPDFRPHAARVDRNASLGSPDVVAYVAALVAELARLPELIEKVLAQNEAIAAVARDSGVSRRDVYDAVVRAKASAQQSGNVDESFGK